MYKLAAAKRNHVSLMFDKLNVFDVKMVLLHRISQGWEMRERPTTLIITLREFTYEVCPRKQQDDMGILCAAGQVIGVIQDKARWIQVLGYDPNQISGNIYHVCLTIMLARGRMTACSRNQHRVLHAVGHRGELRQWLLEGNLGKAILFCLWSNWQSGSAQPVVTSGRSLSPTSLFRTKGVS